jgi:transposase
VAKVKDIIHLYEREDWSKRKIAKHFGLSRGTVDRVVANPDRYLPKSESVDRTSPKTTTQIMHHRKRQEDQP